MEEPRPFFSLPHRSASEGCSPGGPCCKSAAETAKGASARRGTDMREPRAVFQIVQLEMVAHIAAGGIGPGLVIPGVVPAAHQGPGHEAPPLLAGDDLRAQRVLVPARLRLAAEMGEALG